MASAVHCQLNPQVRPVVPTVMAPKPAYRRGKREGGEEPVSKHQIRSGHGRWEGRRGVGRLNPRRETKMMIGENVTNRRKFLARQRRRRGRAERRLLRQSERRNRARARGREITVATHNVRTMTMDRTHGVGRALDVLSVYDQLGATSSIYRRPAAVDSQPSARLATWCTAAVSAVTRMVGRKDKVE